MADETTMTLADTAVQDPPAEPPKEAQPPTQAIPPAEPPQPMNRAGKGGMPPVNPHYVRERIATQDIRKEAHKPGSSKPLPRP